MSVRTLRKFELPPSIEYPPIRNGGRELTISYEGLLTPHQWTEVTWYKNAVETNASRANKTH